MWCKSRSVVSNSLGPHGLYNSGQNTGVGSLCLLQRIFPTQELNRGIIHCRRIFYQLSYQGSLHYVYIVFYLTPNRSVCVCMCAHICSVMSGSFQPHGLYPARLLCPWNLPGNNTGAGCHFLLYGIFPTQWLKLSLVSLVLAGRFFTNCITRESQALLKNLCVLPTIWRDGYSFWAKKTQTNKKKNIQYSITWL